MADKSKYLELAQQMLDTGKTQQATQNTLARKPAQQRFMEQVAQMAPQLGMSPEQAAKAIQDHMAGVQISRGAGQQMPQPEVMRGGSAGASVGEPEIVGSGLPQNQTTIAKTPAQREAAQQVMAEQGLMSGHADPGAQPVAPGDLQADDMLGGAGMIRSLYKHLAASLGEKAAAKALASVPWHEVNPAFKGQVSPGAVLDFLRGEQSAAGNARKVWQSAEKLQPEIDAMPSFAHNAEGLLGDLGLGEVTPAGASAATKPFKVPTK